MIQNQFLDHPPLILSEALREDLLSLPLLAKNPQIPIEQKLKTLTELPLLPSLRIYENLSKILPLCPHLQLWDLDFMAVKDEKWCELLKNVRELQGLSYGDYAYSHLNLEVLVSAINRYCPRLIKLSLTRCIIKENAFSSIASLTQLQELRLNLIMSREPGLDCDILDNGIADKQIKPLKILTNLRVLNLAGNDSLTKEALSLFKHCTKLEALDVRGCKISLKEAVEKTKPKRFPRLISLAIDTPAKLDKAYLELSNSSQLDTVYLGDHHLPTKRNIEQFKALLIRLQNKNPKEITAKSVREIKEEERVSPSLPSHIGGDNLLISLEQIALGFECDRICNIKAQHPAAKIIRIKISVGEKNYKDTNYEKHEKKQIAAKWFFTKCTYILEINPSQEIQLPEAWVHYNCVISIPNTLTAQHLVTIPLTVIQEMFNHLNGAGTVTIDFVDNSNSSEAMTRILLAIDADLRKAISEKTNVLKSFSNITFKINEEQQTIELFVVR